MYLITNTCNLKVLILSATGWKKGTLILTIRKKNAQYQLWKLTIWYLSAFNIEHSTYNSYSVGDLHFTKVIFYHNILSFTQVQSDFWLLFYNSEDTAAALSLFSRLQLIQNASALPVFNLPEFLPHRTAPLRPAPAAGGTISPST